MTDTVIGAPLSDDSLMAMCNGISPVQKTSTFSIQSTQLQIRFSQVSTIKCTYLIYLGLAQKPVD